MSARRAGGDVFAVVRRAIFYGDVMDIDHVSVRCTARCTVTSHARRRDHLGRSIISIITSSYTSARGMRTVKIYSPSNFQVYDTASLAVVTTLHITFQALLTLYLESCTF